MSSPLLRPSRSNRLCNDLRASSLISLSHDLTMASGLVVQPNAVIFWGQDGPALSRLLLIGVAKRVDSTCECETYDKFAQGVEVALSRVVALATCCSTHNPSTIDQSLGVGWADGITILSSGCLMVWMAWLVSSTIPSSWACRFTTWTRLTSICSTTFSFPGF